MVSWSGVDRKSGRQLGLRVLLNIARSEKPQEL